jgi:hypothetical protein
VCKPFLERPKNTYQATGCTTIANAVYKRCTSCGAGKYQADGCSDFSDTVCLPVSSCKSRCTFHTDIDVCFASAVPEIPCHLLKPGPKLQCLVPAEDDTAMVRCMVDPEVNKCVVNSSNVAASNACADHTKDACIINQESGGSCVWDVGKYACRDSECRDEHVPNRCEGSKLGCEYDATTSYCRVAGEFTPCSVHLTPQLCAETNDRCIYTVATKRCHINPTTAGDELACADFKDEILSACPADRCFADSYAQVCRGIAATTPCELYDVQECPGSNGNRFGTLVEFMRIAPTKTSDAQCQHIAAPCVVEFVGTNDQVEYQLRRETAYKDRVCLPVTKCTDKEYEFAAPAATSDRICLPLTPPCSDASSAALYYELTPATASSDRVCRLLTVCNVNGEAATQWMSVAPTASTNRECEPLSECNPTRDQRFTAVARTVYGARFSAGFYTRGCH